MNSDGEKKVNDTVVQKISETEADSVRIAPDVIGIIAGLVASEIKGIAGMSVGIVGGIAEKLGRKDLSKGIKVHLEEERVKLELNVIVEMGIPIVDTANNLKKEVRDTVEKITGLQVSAININVLGINVPKEQEEKSPKKENE
ncbi:MAG: Asp23/Gls24 family envelope stress response protein [Bacillota bacterium]